MGRSDRGDETRPRRLLPEDARDETRRRREERRGEERRGRCRRRGGGRSRRFGGGRSRRFGLGFVRSGASPRGHVAIDGARRASLANRRFAKRGSLVRARRRASSHAPRGSHHDARVRGFRGKFTRDVRIVGVGVRAGFRRRGGRRARDASRDASQRHGRDVDGARERAGSRGRVRGALRASARAEVVARDQDGIRAGDGDGVRRDAHAGDVTSRDSRRHARRGRRPQASRRARGRRGRGRRARGDQKRDGGRLEPVGVSRVVPRRTSRRRGAGEDVAVSVRVRSRGGSPRARRIRRGDCFLRAHRARRVLDSTPCSARRWRWCPTGRARRRRDASSRGVGRRVGSWRAPTTIATRRRRRRVREASSPRRRYSRAWTFSAPLVRPDRERVTFTAPKAIRPGESTTTTIRAGSVAESGGGGAPVAFAFEPLDHDAVARGWRLEPARGTVQPGDIENVVVTFEPPETVSAGHLAYHGVAEWVETTTTCRLKGATRRRARRTGGRSSRRSGAGCSRPRRRRRRRRTRREAAEREAAGNAEENTGGGEGGGDEGGAEDGEEATDA